MKLSDEILKDYFYCKLKAYYKFNKLTISNESFYYFEKYLKKHTDKIFRKNSNITIENFSDRHNLKVGYIYSLNNNIDIHKYTLKYDYIEITKNNLTIPIFISGNLKIYQKDKSFFSYKAKLLGTFFDKKVHHYKVVFHDGKIIKIKVNSMLPSDIEIIDENSKIQKIPHCNICEYKSICHNQLKKNDDIRLLSSISESQVKKLNNIGSFTTKQLSYSYKPRRSSLITSSKSRYKFELKALAIRENKTYVAENIDLYHKDTEVFLDFETLPSENYVYLIGVVLFKKNIMINKLSFWANNCIEEKVIFEKLFDLIKDIGLCSIYHYGAFEIKELKKFNKKHNDYYAQDINYILKNSINILNFFYSNIYPPTYSNGLKEIANFIGFNWTKQDASGLLSIIWRKTWDLIRSNKLQNKLILYNIEDCLALYHVKEWIIKLQSSKEKAENLNELFKHSGFKFGKIKFNIESFKQINKTSYFDYQTNKIFIRDKNYKQEVKKQSKKHHNMLKANTVEYSILPKQCETSFNNMMYKHEKVIRFIVDLKFTKNGIKKWVTEYHEYRYRCSKCYKTISVSKYGKNRYERSLKIWIIYQIFIFNVSYRDIVKMLNDIFNIQISSTTVLGIKKKYSLNISNEYKNILKNILAGNLLHIDETTVTLKKKKHYVWVLTNLTHIYYIYREDRTTDFLVEILKNFKGVMISDFYTAYDRINVNQQKCLIHLMRDINDLIFKNQEDEDLIYIAKLYGDLLNKVVATIDKYGLKKRNLNKHKKDIEIFYEKINKYTFLSDDSIKLKKRFTKYKLKLFTFLNYDGVPWNNNNVEHAIKEFAKYRHKTNGVVT